MEENLTPQQTQRHVVQMLYMYNMGPEKTGPN
jgi:hypothetical protein